ncbi:hypothetical protein K378_01497 [Streptomyces sp. Amel2xB2]|nr:hypothetical protein K378_01497 [Streptomyces sp. Amel2xB2]
MRSPVRAPGCGSTGGDAFTLVGGAPGTEDRPASAADGTAVGAPRGPYDLIYDSGCFHHLPPHRRVSYLALLDRALAPGGHLGLTCFAAGGMGCELDDAELYRTSRLDGGLAYSARWLRWIFSGLTEIELRRMRDEPEDSPYFGEPFLWTALFRRESVRGGREPAPRTGDGPGGQPVGS